MLKLIVLPVDVKTGKTLMLGFCSVLFMAYFTNYKPIKENLEIVLYDFVAGS